MKRRLRIAVSVFFGVLTVLLLAMWVRSYWWFDYAHCPLRSSRTFIVASKMLIVHSYEGRLSTYIGEYDPARTGWFPDGWGIENHSADNVIPKKKPVSSWYFKVNAYGLGARCPYWLPTLVAATLTAASVGRLTFRFSLRTLIILMTLFSVVLGLIAWLTI